MQKIDRTVLKETAYIAGITLVLSAVMQAVFLILNRWDYTVLCGNLLGGFAAVANFFLMGLGVQKALGKEKKEAANIMKLSQLLRFLMLLIVAVVGYAVPVFNTIAAVVPFLFPRIGVMLRPVFNKKK